MRQILLKRAFEEVDSIGFERDDFGGKAVDEVPVVRCGDDGSFEVVQSPSEG